jgi:hypothetical protein
MAAKATMIATTTEETTGMQDMSVLVGETSRGQQGNQDGRQSVGHRKMTVNIN